MNFWACEILQSGFESYTQFYLKTVEKKSQIRQQGVGFQLKEKTSNAVSLTSLFPYCKGQGPGPGLSSPRLAA